LMILIMAVTGLSLAFEDQVAFLKPMHGTIKSIHGFTMYPIIAFIVIHIIGVVLAERKPEGKGIVSDMINGG
jgi:Ni/Fe-hydrogenase 1 B-type cytochrome subunit